jgi:hypothetical protein
MHPTAALPAAYGMQPGVLFPLQPHPVPQQQQAVQYVLVTPMAPDAGPAAENEGAEGSHEDAESAGGSEGTGASSLHDTASYAHSDASDNSMGASGEHAKQRQERKGNE